MTYNIILSPQERKEIDCHNNSLHSLLIESHCSGEWDSDKDILVRVPEFLAWEMADDFEHNVECLSPLLIEKLEKLLTFIGETV